MRTAVDSSVLLDLLLDDAKYGETSQNALYEARKKGSLIICEVTVAEVEPVLGQEKFRDFIAELGIEFVPSTMQSASLAGEMMRRYIQRGGRRGRVIADFLIGAHARILSGQLLARDRGFFRDYFKDLNLVYPS